MKVGISMFATATSIRPDELAREVEARGFESLWMPEHTHIPVSRKSPWGGGPVLPDHYRETLDPFTSLTAAAMVTKRIKLGTGICLVVERDPIHTAKQVASVDYLSGGRFIFGIGGGWNAEEMASHGTEFKTRFTLMRERVEAMKAIWTQDIAEYHGQYVNFEPMWCWPKPVQKPYPPIILGGAFPFGAKRAIEYGDGWMPIGGREQNPLEIGRRFRQMVAEAGRDPASIPMSVYGRQHEAGILKGLAEAGMDRTVMAIPSAPRDPTLKKLDELAAMLPGLGPQ